jgi:H+/Cl- antiporter ClcA
MSGLKQRFGIFFGFVGVAVMALFFTSDVVEKPNLGYLFWGIIFTGLGFYFLRASGTPSEESRRFRLVRKILSRKKKGDGE